MGILASSCGGSRARCGAVSLVMRVQTLFGRMSAEAHEGMMGSALVILRIAFGFYLFTFSESAVVFPLVDETVFMVLGIAFMVGLLTRPAGALFIVSTILVDALVVPFEEVKLLIPLHLVLISVASLGVAGGFGHAAGLNGIVLRNISRPGSLIKMLFG